MRICMFVVIYAVLCYISVVVPETYPYLHPVTDLVQALALENFFLLLCEMVSPNEEQRDTFFSALKVLLKNGSKSPQDGLTWYRVSGVFVLSAIGLNISQTTRTHTLTSRDSE